MKSLIEIISRTFRQIIGETLALGSGEDLLGLPRFDHVAEVEKRRLVGHARRLLHVVRHDDDADARIRDGTDGLLDGEGGDGVQRRARLVEQHHIRMHRERTGDAQALLLTARERHRAAVELVFHLIPQRARSQRCLDQLIRLGGGAADKTVTLRREQDVVANRLAKRRRLLEHHADGFTQLEQVLLRRVDVAPVIEDLAADAALGNLAVHEVQAPQKRRLAATRRPDESRDLTRLEVERGGVKRLVAAVGDREVARADQRDGRGRGSGGRGGQGRSGRAGAAGVGTARGG